GSSCVQAAAPKKRTQKLHTYAQGESVLSVAALLAHAMPTSPSVRLHVSMVDIRIVCARDAVKTAETLRRLLEAEQHRVDVSFGRHSLDQYTHALESGEIALLIWSANAPGAHYMFEWAERFDR